MRKIWQNREGSAGVEVAILHGCQEGLTEKVAFEQRPEEGKRRNKMVPGEQCSKE